jgi:hypothetical protein
MLTLSHMYAMHVSCLHPLFTLTIQMIATIYL